MFLGITDYSYKKLLQFSISLGTERCIEQYEDDFFMRHFTED